MIAINKYIVNKVEVANLLRKGMRYSEVEPKVEEEDIKNVLDMYREHFENKTIEYRIDFLLKTIGISPKGLSPLCKLIYMSRLCLFNRANYIGFQIGNTGQGKSFLFEGVFDNSFNHTGNDSLAGLFGNQASGKEGIFEKRLAVNLDEIILNGKTSKYDNCEDKFRSFFNNGDISRGNEIKRVETSVMLSGNFYRDQEQLYSEPYLFRKDTSIKFLDNLASAFNNRAIKDRSNALFPIWFTKKFQTFKGVSSYEEAWNCNFLEKVMTAQRELFPISNIKINYDLTNGRDYDNVLETLNGLVCLLFPSYDYNDSELEALTVFSIFLKRMVNESMIDLSKYPSYVVFALKIIESQLPFSCSHMVDLYPTFDRTLVKFSNDSEHIYTVPLTMWGEKLSQREFEIKEKVEFHNLIAFSSVEKSNLFILKHKSKETFGKKAVDLSSILKTNISIDNIKDENIKCLISSLAKEVNDLKTETKYLKNLIVNNSKLYKRNIRSLLLEFDEMKEIIKKLYPSERFVSNTEFPQDEEINAHNTFKNSLNTICKYLKKDQTDIKELVLDYDEKSNSLKILHFHDFIQ